jgi:release factor glutamine methyltransferase
LIPRDDTELLVQKTIETIENLDEKVYYFDIGTGSGCIPVSAFSHTQEKIEKLFLFEISSAALDVAKINTQKLTPSHKYNFYCEDFHNFAETFTDLNISRETQIIITANLPYIKIHDIYLDKEVLDHEPTIALFG